MAKIRVYELAKELGLDNKEILAKLRSLKIPVKTHMSVVPDEELERIKKSLADKETDSPAEGVVEKRVAKGVIRRRARAKPAEEEPEQPKMDLVALKQAAAKKARREELDSLEKPTDEDLEGIPAEWTEEETRAEEEKARGPEPAPAPEEASAPEPEPAPVQPPEPEAPAKTEEKLEETPPPEKMVTSGQPEAVEPGPAPDVPAQPEPAKEAAPPKPRRIYVKPELRKTAKIPEGQPIPIPGQRPEAKPEEKPASPEDADAEAKKKKKKKKRGKVGEAVIETQQDIEAAPKKKLRRKIAFKMQRGMEGMEYADVEKMYLPSRKKMSGKKKVAKKTAITTPKAAKRIVKMGKTISVSEFSKQLGVKSREIIKTLMAEGIMADDNYALDADIAGVIAASYNYEINQVVFDEADYLAEESREKPEDLVARPPVVTVMGHVDHGKTSLLDTIRKTRVTEEEAGQITQHIGASVVETSSGKIVFVDTPGHEAFTSMRARGAEVTDIVILVVAADDGIMPQTVEAASHAKAAGVPIIVAVNKIDLPAAKPDVVRQRLSEIDLTPEEWGGDTLVVECSAKSGQGIPDLLDTILLQAEMLELTANPKKPGKGLVIESRLDKGRGPVATIIVQEGTIKKGDVLLVGNTFGRTRALLDDRGKPVKSAGPSIPVEVMGLSGVPDAGEMAQVVENEKKARTVVDYRVEEQRRKDTPQAPAKVSLEDLMARLEEGEVQDLNLIIKADTHGSSEAIKQSAEKLSKEEVRVQVLHLGVGNITENDVLLASASNAVIIGFGVKGEAKARKLAEREGIQIRTYDIIYNLLDDVKASLQGMLKPVFEEEVSGRAEVRKVFRITKVGAIAGCYVTDGVVKRNLRARLLRDGEAVYTGKFKSLKRVQDDVREVAQGLECGIGLENFNDIQEGDVIEAFDLIETTPGL